MMVSKDCTTFSSPMKEVQITPLCISEKASKGDNWLKSNRTFNMKCNHMLTKGVSGSKIFSSRVSFSSLASDKRSADGQLSVCKERDNLDSDGTLF